MPGLTAEKRAWVSQMLGVEPGPAQGEDAKPLLPAWQQAFAAWQDALEQVDKQISGLQLALRATGDEAFKRIADAGLGGMMTGQKVALLGALIEVNRGGEAALRTGAKAALAAIDNFARHIEGDLRIQACDRNHFGVPVAIRAGLAPALKGMRAALSAAPAP